MILSFSISWFSKCLNLSWDIFSTFHLSSFNFSIVASFSNNFCLSCFISFCICSLSWFYSWFKLVIISFNFLSISAWFLSDSFIISSHSDDISWSIIEFCTFSSCNYAKTTWYKCYYMSHVYWPRQFWLNLYSPELACVIIQHNFIFKSLIILSLIRTTYYSFEVTVPIGLIVSSSIWLMYPCHIFRFYYYY